MWWIDSTFHLKGGLFQMLDQQICISIFSLFCFRVYNSKILDAYTIKTQPQRPCDGLDLYSQTMRALSGVILSCIFCFKRLWARCSPVRLCVGRDLLRLGGTLPGHNRKSPDSSQEIVRQQMSQTLPIRVWAAAHRRNWLKTSDKTLTWKSLM